MNFEKAPSPMPDRWHDRFLQAKARGKALVMTEMLGPAADGESPYERCNLWMLHNALAMGRISLASSASGTAAAATVAAERGIWSRRCVREEGRFVGSIPGGRSL